MTSLPGTADRSSSDSVVRAATAAPSVATAPARYGPVAAFLDDGPGGDHPLARLRRRGSALRRVQRDPLLLLSLGLVVPVIAMEAFIGTATPGAAVLSALAFLGGQLVLGRVRIAPRAMLIARFALCMAFVAFANWALVAGSGYPLLSLEIPIVALAASFGGDGVLIVAGIVLLTLAPLATMPIRDDLRRQLLAVAMASGLLAVGSRRVVASMERSRDRLRQAQRLQRRRARQLSAVEAVGGILAHEGPTPRALDSVVGVLLDTFGYEYPSIYTWDGTALHLGAHRNYRTPIEQFPTDRGVIGRVARTREAVFLPDVRLDPEYVSADNGVTGEISVPLLADGELFGVLNVEMPGARQLDEDDFATLKIVGDRVAVALAFGRERQKLTERARLMDRLAGFSRSLGRTLDPVSVNEQVAVGAGLVISADMTILVLREPATGEYRTAQVAGGDPTLLGVRIESGEGITGRALQQGAVVVEDRLERHAFPKGAARARLADTLAAMSAPLLTDQGVVGALSWFREDLGRRFTPQEREVAGLLGAQVALAITNAELHHATEVAAATDPLTGLPNRRHFDAAMARIEAARRREHEDERRPLSAIMFDLDHFGLVNKRHGHQVGDRILQAFAEVVRHRVRASDLTARYGGEEFVIVLDGATRTEAVRLAGEIRERFAGVGFGLPDGAAITCTVSAGCAALAASETSGTVLIERADVGLAMAKSSGRNRVVAA